MEQRAKAKDRNLPVFFFQSFVLFYKRYFISFINSLLFSFNVKRMGFSEKRQEIFSQGGTCCPSLFKKGKLLSYRIRNCLSYPHCILFLFADSCGYDSLN